MSRSAKTAKLDITRAEERGLTMGLNEFFGYVGVAIAGILTAYAADWLGARTGLLVFGMAVVLLALLLTVVWVKDTLPSGISVPDLAIRIGWKIETAAKMLGVYTALNPGRATVVALSASFRWDDTLS